MGKLKKEREKGKKELKKERKNSYCSFFLLRTGVGIPISYSPSTIRENEKLDICMKAHSVHLSNSTFKIHLIEIHICTEICVKGCLLQHCL